MEEVKVTGVTCPKCKARVYSRSRHDFRACPCGWTKVDGGIELERVIVKEEPFPPHEEWVLSTEETLDYCKWMGRSDQINDILAKHPELGHPLP